MMDDGYEDRYGDGVCDSDVMTVVVMGDGNILAFSCSGLAVIETSLSILNYQLYLIEK